MVQDCALEALDHTLRQLETGEITSLLARNEAGEIIGCFGLTESHGGSDPANMKTHAKRRGDDWVLNGSKMWITNGSIADVAVVYSKTDPDAGAKGITAFLVETAWEGYKPGKKELKMGLRGSSTVELHLANVYRKLGVHNRAQLATTLSSTTPPPGVHA